MTVEVSEWLLISVVPQATGLVCGTGSHHRIVRIDPQGQDRLFMTCGGLDGLALVGPAFDHTVCGRRHDPGVVRRVCKACYL